MTWLLLTKVPNRAAIDQHRPRRGRDDPGMSPRNLQPSSMTSHSGSRPRAMPRCPRTTDSVPWIRNSLGAVTSRPILVEAGAPGTWASRNTTNGSPASSPLPPRLCRPIGSARRGPG